MAFAVLLAVLAHVALYFALQGFFQPKAYVVDQTSYQVSLLARADDSETRTRSKAVSSPPPETKAASQKQLNKVQETTDDVTPKPTTKPVPAPAKVAEKAAPKKQPKQVASSEFKERRVNQSEDEQVAAVKPVSKVQPQTTPNKVLSQPLAEAKPAAEQPNKTEQKIVPIEEPQEEVREPEFVMGSPNNPKPVYPNRALSRGWEGDVVLGVHVDPDGTVTYVEILESSNVSALDFAAYSTVKDDWRFSPADEDERSLRGYVTVPISFRIN